MVEWSDKDRTQLRELLAEDALLGRLFTKLEEEDFEAINRITSISGDTVDAMALNAAHAKGKIAGLNGALALIIEYAKEIPDGQ